MNTTGWEFVVCKSCHEYDTLRNMKWLYVRQGPHGRVYHQERLPALPLSESYYSMRVCQGCHRRLLQQSAGR